MDSLNIIICRVCLKTLKHGIALFSSLSFRNNKSFTLLDVLLTCAPSIQITENDGLSQSVCKNCVENAKIAFTFKTLCEESDKFLHSVVIKENTSIKTEILNIEDASTFEGTGRLCNEIEFFSLLDSDTEKHDYLNSNNNNDDFVNNSQASNSHFQKVEVLEYCREDQEYNNDFGLQFTKISSCKEAFPIRYNFSLDEPHKIDFLQLSGHVSTSQIQSQPKNEIIKNGLNQILKDELAIRSKKSFSFSSNGPRVLEKYTSSFSSQLNKGCSLCNKIFINEKTFNAHMKVHDNIESEQAQDYMSNNMSIKMNDFEIIRKNSIGKAKSPKDVSTQSNKILCFKTFLKPLSIGSYTKYIDYACEICNTIFYSANSLNFHMKTHEDVDSQALDMNIMLLKNTLEINEKSKTIFPACSTNGQKQLKERVVNNNASQFKKICLICDRTFLNKSILKAHLKTHEDIISQEPVVDNIMISKNTLDINEKSDKNSPICSSNDEKQLKKNLNDTDGSINNLHEKKYLTASDIPKKKLKEKRRRNKSQIRQSCKYCKFVPNPTKKLAQHVKEEHDYLKQIPCSVCDKKFLTENNLKVHMVIHSGTRSHCCQICGKGFFYRQNLSVHQKIHSPVKKFSCSTCNKSFSHSSNLRNHILIHLNRKDHVCPQCGKAFRTSSAFYVHVRHHSTVKSYVCQICNAAFKSNGSLNSHKYYVHNNKKKHVCDLCGSKFRTNGQLKVHLRVHTGEKPYVCLICNKGFTQSHCLKTHLNNHQ